MDRRSFLALTGSFIVLPGSRTAAQPAPGRPAVRRLSIATFSKNPSLVSALRKAFELLRGRPASALVGNFNYAAIHWIPKNDPQAPTLPASQKAYWDQCHRDEGLFFIWHRAYLSALERNLQILSGRSDLGLPYWDWYTDPTLPQIFRADFLDAARQQPNWLYDQRRDKDVQNGAAVWNGQPSGALDQPSFNVFQQQLNGGEHGDIHLGIGGTAHGDMYSVPTAARDPIFWLHHCNIDRLLAAWVHRGGAVPDQSAAFDGKYRFPIENAADLSPVASAMDMGSETPLSVTYESLEAPFSAPQKSVSPPPVTQSRGASTRKIGPQAFAFNTPQRTDIPAKGLSISFARPSPKDGNLLSAMRTAPLESATSITIVLEGVRMASPPRGLTGYDVYLNLPDSGTSDPRRFKIGSIPLFALTMEPMPGVPGMPASTTYRFPALRSLQANDGLRSGFMVSLVPRMAPYGDRESVATGLTVDDFRIEASSEPIM